MQGAKVNKALGPGSLTETLILLIPEPVLPSPSPSGQQPPSPKGGDPGLILLKG